VKKAVREAEKWSEKYDECGSGEKFDRCERPWILLWMAVKARWDLEISVGDLWHFGADPDLGISISD
jgi:hypothetical protein